jgi:NADH-quinone oxidoreductase subunit B
LFEKIESQSIRTVPWYRKGEIEAIPVPVLGPDLIDLRRAVEIKEYTQTQINAAPAPATEPAHS